MKKEGVGKEGGRIEGWKGEAKEGGVWGGGREECGGGGREECGGVEGERKGERTYHCPLGGSMEGQRRERRKCH